MKQDEIDLIKSLVKSGFAESLIIPTKNWDKLTKRDYYILEKWSKNGYWEYGVSTRGGWTTQKGLEYFNSLRV